MKERERKLPVRRRKASKGHVIRVSDDVYSHLNKQRYGKSWDSFFRRMLGLPDREGNEPRLIEGVLETMTGRFFLRPTKEVAWDNLLENAYEVAILEAARLKVKQVNRPAKMREIP